MAEIMPILARLSKTFQIENIDYSSIRPAIERAKSSIGTLVVLSKSKSADWQTELQHWKETSSEPLTGLTQDEFLAQFALPFLSAVEKNLLDRFPERYFCFVCCSCFCPQFNSYLSNREISLR